MNDIITCKLDGCENRVLSKLRMFCDEQCASVDSYKRNNKRVSDVRLEKLIEQYSNVNHLFSNSSIEAYKEAMELIRK